MSKGFLKAARRLTNNSNIEHVPCRSLESILHLSPQSLRPSFDLLSLDVEGAEAKVISTVDPAAFSVIIVEMDGSNHSKDRWVEKKILQAGLRRQAAITRSGDGIGPIHLSTV